MTDHRDVYVVAGGSRGLGRVLVAEILRQGYPTAIIARNFSALDALRSDLGSIPGSEHLISIHQADLSIPAEADRVFGEIKELHGQIDVLINAMGTLFIGKQIEELSADEMQRALDLNFFAPFNACKSLLRTEPPLADGSRNLRIINIGATASWRGRDGAAAFGVAKSALRSFSQSLSRELAASGVHVAHLVIDGALRGREDNGEDPKLIDPVAVARTILHMASQDRTCWTFEWDVRSYKEKW